MCWDADQVGDDPGLRRDRLCRLTAQLGDADAVLVLDETGFIKKGTNRSGCSGSIRHGRADENCRIGVFLGYASRHGHTLIDSALYLPEIWANDPARRGGAPPACPRTLSSPPSRNWGGRC